MDFITDLPMTNGFNAIFTCVDRLTKYTKLIPCVFGISHSSAAEVASLFFENIVHSFGVPSNIVHDRDPHFTSLFWRELWSLMGTKSNETSAYHPQPNG